ncbi:MAG: dockerin type I repeat-containing protein [Ruminococcus sp.]|nr:dockerin type I repeat-containing protein [Candidatus Copronaster equi]
MRKTNKIISLLMSMVMILSCCGLFASAANSDAAYPVSMKIVTMPKRTTFYKESDWKYGYYEVPETGLGEFVPCEGKVAFVHNGGYDSRYPEKGMLDMTGLVISVTYSDGSKSNMTYTETKRGTHISQNICASPTKSYHEGENTVEIYFAEYIDVYTSFKVNLLGYDLGDVNQDGKVNSSDALAVLQHTVNIKKMTSTQLLYADMDFDSKYNSTDALNILRKAVQL